MATTTKNARTPEEVKNAIIEYFENNEDIFNKCIEELDSWNGYLGDNRYYDMEYLNEFYRDIEPLELLQRAYFGRDDDNWHTDAHGSKHYGEFNPNRNYFTYNGYGNLVSTDYPDYSAHLDLYAVDSMLENRQYLDNIDDDDELSALFDELEQGGE